MLILVCCGGEYKKPWPALGEQIECPYCGEGNTSLKYIPPLKMVAKNPIEVKHENSKTAPKTSLD